MAENLHMIPCATNHFSRTRPSRPDWRYPQFNIEDDYTVHIYASKQEGLDRAKAMSSPPSASESMKKAA